MLFSLCTLLVAVCLSLVSAYYSVLGLSAIFAAAVVPIVIMGIVLETAKIMATVWLHNYWDIAPFKIKLYLIPSILALMVLTSLGGFGFLSKAHLDQMLPAGNIQNEIDNIDQHLSILDDSLKSTNTEYRQIGDAISQIVSRTNNASGVFSSFRLAKNQQKNKDILQSKILEIQSQIETLGSQRVILEQKLNKVNLDVGPIRYLAQLIYGSHASGDVLESSVRIVIILIVIVFDPLALVMILAATTSLEWESKIKKTTNIDSNEKKIHELEHQINTIVQSNDSSRLIMVQDHHVALTNLSADALACQNEIIARGILWNQSQMAQLSADALACQNEIIARGILWNQSQMAQLSADALACQNEIIARGILWNQSQMAQLSADSDIDKDEGTIADKFKILIGTVFPESASANTIFMRTDFLPYKTFLWSENSWEEVKENNKNMLTSAHIESIIQKIEDGVISVCNLSTLVISHITSHLEDHITRLDGGGE